MCRAHRVHQEEAACVEGRLHRLGQAMRLRNDQGQVGSEPAHGRAQGRGKPTVSQDRRKDIMGEATNALGQLTRLTRCIIQVSATDVTRADGLECRQPCRSSRTAGSISDCTICRRCARSCSSAPASLDREAASSALPVWIRERSCEVDP